MRAGQIIRRLRDFVSRGESERRVESIGKLVEEASALALVGVKDRGIRVRFQFDPSVDLVLADRVQIQQVLLNLIRNAMDAMESSEMRDLTIAIAPNRQRLCSRQRCRHRLRASRPKSPDSCFNLSSRRNATAWASDCRFHAPSSKRMAGKSGSNSQPVRRHDLSFHAADRESRRMSTMQSEQTVYVIDDDEAVRQSLEFLLKTARHRGSRLTNPRKAFLEILPPDQIRLHHH